MKRIVLKNILKFEVWVKFSKISVLLVLFARIDSSWALSPKDCAYNYQVCTGTANQMQSTISSKQLEDAFPPNTVQEIKKSLRVSKEKNEFSNFDDIKYWKLNQFPEQNKFTISPTDMKNEGHPISLDTINSDKCSLVYKSCLKKCSNPK